MGPLQKLVLPVLFCSAAVFTGASGAQAPVERVAPPPPDYTPHTSAPAPPTPAPPIAAPPPIPSPGPAISSAGAPQPPGVAEAFSDLTSQPVTRSSFTLDRDLLSAVLGNQPIGIQSVTVTNYHFQTAAFYVPEALAALRSAYGAAGWKHLIEAHVSPREEVSPQKPITDLWLHFHGASIDDIAVLVRSSRQMSVVGLSGSLRPLDLIHLGGHFGIPKVDPDTVMVPAPPGR